ncbi:uncharacterized protein BHQ10_004593 [Talaromyces amestolkiae]|uniref:Uncharacterized protein n=1 Tax=Talaromyces amestolkiae TaxID=1196081 RepID=A0A364KYL9_TALAM|nr:uncharacterized protein BHQ10_004593 [Talaromyces amestolkiae]RAO68581.1 hypothetical protein BHQ10_004593 [Talaromyces amestolkiae]
MPTTPGKAKTMSSRLLTMKFMQRAAASSNPAPVEDPETPSPKRQRLSTEPGTPRTTSDLDAVNAALAAEEQRRADAIARQAAEAGESNWVLNFEGPAAKPAVSSQPMIVAADSLDAEDQELSNGGRKTYGGFKSRSRRIVFEAEEEDLPADPKERAEYMAEKKRIKEKDERKADRVMQNATSISGGGGARTATVNDRDKNKKHGGKSGKKRSK